MRTPVMTEKAHDVAWDLLIELKFHCSAATILFKV
jgi:hypothetical protein